LFEDVTRITTSAATANAISSGPSESFITARKYIMNGSRRFDYILPAYAGEQGIAAADDSIKKRQSCYDYAGNGPF
jgi:hypothetical protein